jgi:hypothetical protein
MTRGTSPVLPRRKQPASRVPLTIRIPEEVVQKIDLDLGRRAVPVSRNNWLLEAALEKLRRSRSEGPDGTK